MCVRACVRTCLRACVRTCLCASVRAPSYPSLHPSNGDQNARKTHQMESPAMPGTSSPVS